LSINRLGEIVSARWMRTLQKNAAIPRPAVLSNSLLRNSAEDVTLMVTACKGAQSSAPGGAYGSRVGPATTLPRVAIVPASCPHAA
jgi:hypothetical protein